MLNENKAREIVESIKDELVVDINYLGFKMVPYSNIKTTYDVFPQEIKGKEVHVFEARDKGKAAVCRYYVDCDETIYKDTYPNNTKCIKIK